MADEPNSAIDIKLLAGEPYFIVYGRDDQFASIVETWADRREADIRCGTRPPSDRDQVINARHLAATGAEWRRRNNMAWRDPSAQHPTGVPWNATMAPPPKTEIPVKAPVVTAAPTSLLAEVLEEQSTRAQLPNDVVTIAVQRLAAAGDAKLGVPVTKPSDEPPPSPPDPKVMGMVFKPPAVAPIAKPVLPMPKALPPVVAMIIPPDLLKAINSAVDVTNTPELYSTLLAFIHHESAFNPNAVAKGGTAAGLLQFTHVTWTEMIAQVGKTFKLNAMDILDPYTNAVVGCVRLKNYKQYLQQVNPTLVTAGNMYCLHFLGINGGNRLIQTARGLSTQASPEDTAAHVFPVAALANPGVFYENPSSLHAYTIAEVYVNLTQEMDAIEEAYVTSGRPAVA
jgi:hypothetical protein